MLQLLNSGGQCGLRNMACRSSSGEVTFFGKCDQVLKFTCKHDHDL